MEDLMIWVDENDEIVGYGEKLETHKLEQLHRAFSVFVYDREAQKLLIQKRASGKYHSGGKWSNSCCSHPRKGEELEAALRGRLAEELGFYVQCAGDSAQAEFDAETELPPNSLFHYMGKFTYFAPFEGLAEHEIDKVFVYYCPAAELAEITANPDEAEELMWIGLDELDQWLADSPETFSTWFERAYELARPALG